MAEARQRGRSATVTPALGPDAEKEPGYASKKLRDIRSKIQAKVQGSNLSMLNAYNEDVENDTESGQRDPFSDRHRIVEKVKCPGDPAGVIIDSSVAVPLDWSEFMKSKRDSDSKDSGSSVRFDENTKSIKCVLCRRQGPSDQDMEKTLKMIPKRYLKGITAGRIELKSVPVDFQDLYQYDNVTVAEQTDRQKLPLCYGYILEDRTRFVHTCKRLHASLPDSAIDDFEGRSILDPNINFHGHEGKVIKGSFDRNKPSLRPQR